MRMKLRWLLLGLLPAAIGACAANSSDPGPYPSDYEDIVKSFLHSSLKDPYSIRDLSITPPVQKTAFMGLLGGGSVAAYSTCVTYNAKNGFGAYTGISSNTYYIRNGAILVNGLGVLVLHPGC